MAADDLRNLGHGKFRPSTANCTWRSFPQKLDHFGADGQTFPQRLCIYDKWWRNASLSGFKARGTAPGPIFFYTGNESPVDEYDTWTGRLMFHLLDLFFSRVSEFLVFLFWQVFFVPKLILGIQ